MPTIIQVTAESLVLDVSGAHATPHDDVTLPGNSTLIRVADVVKRLDSRRVRKAGLRAPAVIGHEVHKTMDIRSDEPLVLYVWREQTGRHQPLINLIASLKTPPEDCSIDALSAKHLLFVRQEHGQTYVRFTKHVKKKQLLDVTVTCETTTQQSNSNNTTEPFVINLQVHIV